MLRVGLSGGIGSGKSTVAKVLRDLGAVIIDSDAIAREVLATGTPGLARVADRFGPEVIDAEGALDRPALGRVVFADRSARRDLEAITHPLIAARTAELFRKADAGAIVVHDVPLLVEKGMGPAYHLVVIVHSELDQRVQRLVQDRGMAQEEAHARIRSQADTAARRAAADIWLENTAGVPSLRASVQQIWTQRLVPYEELLRVGAAHHPPHDPAIVAPDPTWPAQGRRLVARLHHVLSETADEIWAIEHIGDTATAGSPAADVLDIEVLVPDPSSWAAQLDSLAAAGFVEVGSQAPNERLLHGSDPGRPVRVHIRQPTA